MAGIGSEIKSDSDTDANLRMVAGKEGEIIKYANFGELSSKLSDFKKKVCGKWTFKRYQSFYFLFALYILRN